MATLVLFTTKERERIQVEAGKSVLVEDRQPTQNPDLINAAFPLSRPTWDHNSAEGKERLRAHHQTLMAGLQAATRKPTDLAKVDDVRQVTGTPETWPRSCWPQPWTTHRKDRGTSRSWPQGQISLHLINHNFWDNVNSYLKTPKTLWWYLGLEFSVGSPSILSLADLNYISLQGPHHCDVLPSNPSTDLLFQVFLWLTGMILQYFASHFLARLP
ncbi:unnamed protein product [Nyctereutes procyonoides]|uniref:(raccoon dog) hypothetical protein n=1 Tax=Nyctereutes procyonoides TaxID=34880 RepID=A0A811ZEE9_NYCPR|nr:unnamed protein product [Nyctereutes procyonoides]